MPTPGENRVAKNLLIIEDQDVLSESLSRRFTRRGFGVTIAAEPSEVLRVLGRGGIDLCISDIDLTNGASGVELFGQVRAAGIDVPFLFLSGHDESSAAMQSALGLGAAGVFTKPTDFAVLLGRVCEVLGVPAEAAPLTASK